VAPTLLKEQFMSAHPQGQNSTVSIPWLGTKYLCDQ
jgi:hypothetical protein